MSGGKLFDVVERVDAKAKARGEAKYISDYKIDGMLYSKLVRSEVPRAKIIDIKIPSLPEGYYYVSDKDIKEGCEHNLYMIKKDWRCFATGEVLFVGEILGILVGPDRTVLQDLFEKIEVEYEELESAISIDEALALKGGPIIGDDNITCSLVSEKGEAIDDVLKKADRIIEETIETGFQEHVHIEPNGAIASIEDGKYVITASAQCPFYIRKSVAGLLGLQPEDIIVRQSVTGGAFGGKENFPDVLIGPLLVAESVVKKPIGLFFTREEEMKYTVKRHPSKIKFKTGVDKNGRILGSDIEVYYNTGPYLSSSFVVLQRGVFHANGVYNFPATRIKGFGVATNTYPSDAFRGFGAPQTLFAIEMHMNHIAKKLGIDPVEYKKSYFLKKGDETVTQGHIVENVVLDKMLDQVVSSSDYYNKSKKYGYGSYRGIGMSFYNHGGAFTGNGEQALIKAKVKLVKEGDIVHIRCGSTEMGQGFKTVLIKIVSNALDIPFENVTFDDPDTSKVSDSGPTVASRSTMVVGKVAENAALEMKRRWSEGDFEVISEYQHPDGYPWDQSTFKGDAYLGYGWGVCCVELEVDKNTNEVKVLGIWSSHDIGKAIDELIVHGQINGGIIQSLGYASMEKLENKKGHFKQASMSDYVIPTSMDFPKQECFLCDNPYLYGPQGAKGMGELVFNGADSAYCDALERALGVNTYRIPLPEEDIEELRNAN